jgi:prophage regulatory protein
MTETILRLPQVRTRTGLSRSSIYAAVARGEFSKPVKLGARSVGWPESEVSAWIERRIAESRGAAA